MVTLLGAEPVSLRGRAQKAALWTIGSTGLQKGLQLASNLILTRLLFPEAFGLMSLAWVFLTGLAMFSDLGLRQSVVQSLSGSDNNFLNTVWTLQIARGFGIWLVAIIIAWPLSEVYHRDELFPILAALGSTSAISGLSSIGLVIAERRVNLRPIAIAEVVNQAVTLCVTTGLAWWTQSVWALVAGAIFGALSTLGVSYIIAPRHNHKLLLHPDHTRKVAQFGQWIFIATAVTYLGGQGLRAVQALMIPISTLGILTVAQTFAWGPGDIVQKLGGIVGFPAISEVVRDRPRDLRTVVAKVQRAQLSFSIPLFMALAIFAVPLISALYDRRYLAAGPMLSICALAGALSVLPITYQSAWLAQGNTKRHAIVMSLSFTFKVLGTYLGALTGGVTGMLWGLVAGSFAHYILVMIVNWRERFDYRYDIISVLLISLVAAGKGLGVVP